MHHKKILVPISLDVRNLKSVRYALALGQRLHAHIYILQQSRAERNRHSQAECLNDTLGNLISNARQAGIRVEHFLVDANIEEEIVHLARSEPIDVLVFNTHEQLSERLLFRIKPLVPSQIIQVREKNGPQKP